MHLRTELPPMEVRFIHGKLGFAGWLVVGFQRRLAHRISTEIEHAGQRREHDHLHLLTNEEGRFDVHRCDCSVPNDELVAAGQTLAVKEAIKLEKIIRRVRLPHPEFAEIGKFFRSIDAGVNR